MPEGSPTRRLIATRAVQSGITYLIMLFSVAVMGVALVAVATVWTTAVTREKEEELLFVGQQFRAALLSYSNSSPAGSAKFPETLDELLLDKRFPSVQRHLRRLYRDPFTGKPLWGLLYQQGRIVGVYSLAEGTPIKVDGFPPELSQFAKSTRYAQWAFIVDGVTGPTAPGITTAAIMRPVQNGPPPPGEPDPQQPIPTPPAPCTAEYDNMVAGCWSDAASNERNAECEAKAQLAYNACMRAHLTR
jgi:type II secretory pathway pseudopilin PulG